MVYKNAMKKLYLKPLLKLTIKTFKTRLLQYLRNSTIKPCSTSLLERIFTTNYSIDSNYCKILRTEVQ